MKVVIEFNADTAAFEDDFSNCLLHIMDQIHDKTYAPLLNDYKDEEKILDPNGNTIGTIRVVEEGDTADWKGLAEQLHQDSESKTRMLERSIAREEAAWKGNDLAQQVQKVALDLYQDNFNRGEYAHDPVGKDAVRAVVGSEVWEKFCDTLSTYETVLMAEEGDHMTVAELIEKLKEMPQDSVVLVSSDGEGNSIRALADVENACRCEEDGREYSLIHPDDNDPEDPRGEECVVLWP